MTPLSVLSLAPDSRAQVDHFVNYFIEELEGGRLDSLKVMFMCKAWEETIEAIKEAVKKDAVNEASKYGKGDHEMGNFKFSIMNTGGKPNYSRCADPILTSLEDQVRKRQEYLKSLKNPTELVDEETGEVIGTIYPVVKKSGETVKISLK